MFKVVLPLLLNKSGIQQVCLREQMQQNLKAGPVKDKCL